MDKTNRKKKINGQRLYTGRQNRKEHFVCKIYRRLAILCKITEEQ